MKYSQYDEEHILDFFFKKKKDGFVVDIGAVNIVGSESPHPEYAM
jgi:hypothetical protein